MLNQIGHTLNNRKSLPKHRRINLIRTKLLNKLNNRNQIPNPRPYNRNQHQWKLYISRNIRSTASRQYNILKYYSNIVKYSQ